MGKTKTKIIDDSQPEVEEKKKPSKKKLDVRSEKMDEEVGSLKVGENQTSNLQPPTPSSNIQLASRSEHPTSKSTKPGKAKPRSKKYQEITKDLDRSKTYPLSEAVDMVKKLNYAKFDATLEAHINTVQTGLRGLVSLPYVSGKKLTILAFGKDADTSGADIVGNDNTVEEISKGQVNFDLVITTPEWMPKLAKVARILGPRSLMPNPKNGTVTDDLKKAVTGFQAGKTEYKTEPKAAVIHLGLGKLDQPTDQLSQNIKVLLQTLGKTKVKKITLSPTMGPSVKVDLASI